MSSVINLPTKDYVKCKPIEYGFRVYNNEGYTVCEIRAATPEGIADQIAHAIISARDAGFEMGRAHVRKALGIDEGM